MSQKGQTIHASHVALADYQRYAFSVMSQVFMLLLILINALIHLKGLILTNQIQG